MKKLTFMKKLLSITICLLFIGSVFAQEKFVVPERTPEQKHRRTTYMLWSWYSAGINFANSQGVSAYDYGKYVGTLFAKGWNKENGFDGFVNGMIFNYENMRFATTDEITIKENDDGSVVVTYPAVMIKSYFPEGNPYASYQEGIDCFRGVLENIGDYLGCTVSQEVTEDLIVITFRKKQE